MTGSVSVIIPAFNAEKYITKAIESVLAQTVPVLEVIVVDDGSTDRTVAAASAFGNQVRVISKVNAGPASARNLAASHARGDWLATLDADDWWFAYKNEIQLQETPWPEVGMSHCRFDHRNDLPPAELTFEDLWHYNWVGNSSVMLRRSVFEQVGGFNEDRRLISVEDYNLWLRVAATGVRIRTCDHILAHYTTGIGISSNSERLMRASLFNLDDIAEKCRLSPAMVSQRKSELLTHFGRQTLHERRTDLARPLLAQTFRRTPSPGNALRLAAAHLPTPLLDLKRTVVRPARQFFFRWVRQTGEPVADEGLERAPIQVKESPFWSSNEKCISIFDRSNHHAARVTHLPRPMVLTTIDAEEDFDWNSPFSSGSNRVISMRSQYKAHEVFSRFGVIPTYLVDYPVASQEDGRAPLRDLMMSGLCEVGAQLHPWVTPPFVENVNIRNSFPGNLPFVVEYEKLQRLTGTLREGFGTQPLIYRAGRCGVGPNTGAILEHLGYQADTSVMPFWDYRHQGGPDFHAMTPAPYWLDKNRTILELPISAGLVGRAAGLPSSLSAPAFSLAAQRTGVTSVLARLGMLERIRLSPEGITIQEAKRLVRYMVACGHKVFVLTYHSPSLEPGNTPYVRTSADLARFLDWLAAFYDFFINDIGGEAASWRTIRDALAAPDIE
jgi:GT2 family glycosyltransferase